MKRFVVAAVLALSIPPCALMESAEASRLPALNQALSRGWGIGKHYVEVDDGVFVAVRGSRERRQVRFFRLRDGWSSDQSRAADRYGFPVYRYRDLTAGVLTEIWTYPEKDVDVIFDGEGRFLETRLR
jgi:hypothetical protein